MTAASALFLAAALAAGDLDPAQAAFDRKDHAQAEALALAAARPPHAGAALNLVGLARFRAGKHAEALDAFEQAGKAADPPEPGLWHYNKASCLYELGRHGEAEAEYEQAAALASSLAAVSLVNAGFAALDAGATERAKALAARARAADTGAALDLVKDLEAHIAGGERALATETYHAALAAFDAGRFAEAREAFHRAAALDPADGRSLIMSGAASIRLGQRAEARADLQRALGLTLSPADARTARDHLDSISHGLSAGGMGLHGTAQIAAGFDSNALQTDDRPGSSVPSSPSAIATAAAALAFRHRPTDQVATELAYGFDQLANFAEVARDYSVQQHALAASAELSLRNGLRLGGTAGGQLAFTGSRISGVPHFRGLQLAGAAGGWAALDQDEIGTTRLQIDYARKGGLSEFSYLTGDRFDAMLLQQIRLPALSLEGGYRFRAELIGTVRSQPPAPPDPLAYTSHAGWLGVRRAFGARLLLEASGGLEWRSYEQDRFAPFQRRDTRWFGAAGASLWLTSDLALTLRYDLTLNRSTADRSFDKHAFTAGTTFSW